MSQRCRGEQASREGSGVSVGRRTVSSVSLSRQKSEVFRCGQSQWLAEGKSQRAAGRKGQVGSWPAAQTSGGHCQAH